MSLGLPEQDPQSGLSVSDAIYLEAFDHEKLKSWFQQLTAQSSECRFTFRQADNGKYVLPPATQEESAADRDLKPSPGTSDFLKYVAAYSLGIPGIAWAVWRHSLSFAITGEDHAEKTTRKAESEGDKNCAYPIWVKPWSQLILPEVPNQWPLHPMLMVLHTLPAAAAHDYAGRA